MRFRFAALVFFAFAVLSVACSDTHTSGLGGDSLTGLDLGGSDAPSGDVVADSADSQSDVDAAVDGSSGDAPSEVGPPDSGGDVPDSSDADSSDADTSDADASDTDSSDTGTSDTDTSDGGDVDVLPPCTDDSDCTLARKLDDCCSCFTPMSFAEVEADPCAFLGEPPVGTIPDECVAECIGLLCEECVPYASATCFEGDCLGVPDMCCHGDEGCPGDHRCVGAEIGAGGVCLAEPAEEVCYYDEDCAGDGMCEGETVCSCDMNCISEPGECVWPVPQCEVDADCDLAVKIDDCCYCPMAMTPAEMTTDPCIFPLDAIPDPIPEVCESVCLGIACEACMWYAGADCADGSCVPVLGQGECCSHDSHCQGELVCALSEPNYMGTCVAAPEEGRCWKDEHCAEGFVCNGAAICPCGWDCDMDMMEGPGFCQAASCTAGQVFEEGIGEDCATPADACIGQEANMCSNQIFSDPTLPMMCTRYCNDLTPCPDGTYCHPAGWSSSCIPNSCADPFLKSCVSDVGCKLATPVNVCCACPQVYTVAQIEMNPCLIAEGEPYTDIPEECIVMCPAVVCDVCLGPAGAACSNNRCVGVGE